MNPIIRQIRQTDCEAICDIYNYYVGNSTISFEEQPVSFSEMEKRILEISEKYPWLVLENAGEIQGFAYAHKWKERIAYRYSAELSIYLKHGFEGKGMGSFLLSHLLEELRKTNIHYLISGITLPNDRSVALHEKFGFTKAAQLHEIGYKKKWLDVGYWELVLKK
jgi:phosphinothricin acetyltransferase